MTTITAATPARDSKDGRGIMPTAALVVAAMLAIAIVSWAFIKVGNDPALAVDTPPAQASAAPQLSLDEHRTLMRNASAG
jgi:hypothetical protein